MQPMEMRSVRASQAVPMSHGLLMEMPAAAKKAQRATNVGYMGPMDNLFV